MWHRVLCTATGPFFGAVAGLQGRAWAAVLCGSVPGAAPLPVLEMKAPVNVAKPAGQLLQNMSCPAAVCLVPQVFCWCGAL